jgi:hypothetical protein
MIAHDDSNKKNKKRELVSIRLVLKQTHSTGKGRGVAIRRRRFGHATAPRCLKAGCALEWQNSISLE